MTQTRPVFRLIAAFALAGATVSCNLSDPNAPAPNLTHTFLTDGPFPYDRVARVDVYVISVEMSFATDTSATAGGDFRLMAAPKRKINLLNLANGSTDLLGAVEVPPGAVKSVRMTIDTDSSSMTLNNGKVLTATSSPGIKWQSSAGKPVLNALVDDILTIPDSGGSVVVEMDVGKAFIPNWELTPGTTDSSYVFSPVIHAADATRTGSITGTVRQQTTNGVLIQNASIRLYVGKPGNPENTWSTLATAKTDINGAFKFGFVTRSAYWAALAAHAGDTYIVAVDPPTGSPYARQIIPNVTVTTGVETKLGNIALP